MINAPATVWIAIRDSSKSVLGSDGAALGDATLGTILEVSLASWTISLASLSCISVIFSPFRDWGRMPILPHPVPRVQGRLVWILASNRNCDSRTQMGNLD